MFQIQYVEYVSCLHQNLRQRLFPLMKIFVVFLVLTFIFRGGLGEL